MFSRNRLDREDRPKFGAYLKARGNRVEYWACVATLMALAIIFPKLAGGGAAGFMLVITVRRLHDFGQTGWWAALPFVAGVIGGVTMITVPALTELVQAASLVAGVVFTAFIGFMPGDAGPNRFGDPVVSRRKQADLGETFS